MKFYHSALALIIATISITVLLTYAPALATTAGNTGCHNGRMTPEEVCKKCGVVVACPETESEQSPSSVIHNGRQRIHHTATDYLSTGTGSSSCGSCAGAPSKFDLPSLTIQRQFLSRIYPHDAPDFGKNVYLRHYTHQIINTGSDRLIYTNYDQNKTAYSLVYNSARQCWVDNYTRSIFGCFLYNEAGALITDKSLRNTAASAIIVHHDGTTEHYDYFYHQTPQGAQGHGKTRLTSIMDRRGNSTDITYQIPIPANRISLEAYALRKINTITDAYGRQASFAYHPVISNRYHYIKSITLPNSEVINYQLGYLPGISTKTLTKVTHPDGTESNFSSTVNEDGLTVLGIQDSTADGAYSRNKTVYISTATGVDGNGNSIATVVGMTRRVDNGTAEMSYANREAGSGDQILFEGGNKVTRTQYGIKQGIKAHNDLPATIIDNGDGTTSEQYPWENNFFGFDTEAPSYTIRENYIKHGYTFQTEHIIDTQGRRTSYPRDPVSQHVIGIHYPDGTVKTAPKNAFQQALLITDRLGRQTNNIYDAQGNILSRTRGLGSADETTTTYLYNLRGQIIETRDALYDPNQPELHNTRYEYDTAGYLTKKIASADTAGGTRPETVFTYDTAGRLASVTDPVGRTTSFEYDTRSRLVKTTYNDTSYEEITYGTDVINANLVTQMRDRNGIITTYTYDNAGRKTETKLAAGLPEESLETSTYLSGTSLKTSHTLNGETTSYHYDHYNRLLTSTTHANADTELITTREYDQKDRLRSTTDPYGRKTFYLYDQNDRITRTVTETYPDGLSNVPAIVADSSQSSQAHTYSLTDKDNNDLDTTGTHKVTYTDPRDTYLAGLTRITTANAPYLITDTIHDTEGQTLISTDPRGNNTWMEYDELGRTTLTIQAVGTPSEIRMETDYDDASNIVETRSPRHFSEGTNSGTNITLAGVGKDTYTYNGRNLKKSHTTAPGSPIEATQSWTYYLDGRLNEHTDFRSNLLKQIYHACCGRLQATIDRDGASTTIFNTDYLGQSTHTAIVSTSPVTAQAPGNSSATADWHNPSDTLTLRETTTRFDGRGRPTHTTTWLNPRGTIDDDARTSLGDPTGIPIAGLDGIPATQGLTTTYRYDEKLNDSTGISGDYTTQLTALGAAGINLNTADVNGYAIEITNPEGEKTVQVQDGAGRTVMTIDPEGHYTITSYDETETIAILQGNATDAPEQDPLEASGWNVATVTLLKTQFTDANGNTNSAYTDGAGRTLVTKDPADGHSFNAFDANSNPTLQLDPNNLGQTCTYDALNRKTECADRQEQSENTDRQWTYNTASQVLTSQDAQGETTTTVYDARGRTTTTTDPNNITVEYTYDANNNLTALEDGNGNTRTWTYNTRNLATNKQYPGNAADNLDYTHDSLRRLSTKTLQDGTKILHTYDLAGRLTDRDYTQTDGITQESTDTFTYDRASRLLTTNKGRHNIATTHTYNPDGTPATEKFTADSREYTIARTYDAGNRPITQTFEDDKVQAWNYDNRNLVTTATYEGTTTLTQTHDDGYRLTTQAFGNNLTRTITYGRNDNLRTTDNITGKPSLQMSYTYAEDKQILSESIAGGVMADSSFTAGYDAGNRVTSWNRTGTIATNSFESQTWNYDNAGNWNSTNIDGNTQNRTNNAADQPTVIGGTATTHDARGNLTSFRETNIIAGNIDHTLAFDSDNRLVTATISTDSNSATYRYDAFGRRIIREHDGTKTAYLWWGNQEVSEHKHQAGQTTIQNDLWAHPTALNTLYARAVDGSKFDIQYYHKNYLDHVYAITDDSGDILEHYRYNAFGKVEIYTPTGTRLTTTAINNHITWNTRRTDALTGYHYYLFRHYVPQLGRWPSRDPMEESWQTSELNLFAFLGGDTVNWFDVTGLFRGSYRGNGGRRGRGAPNGNYGVGFNSSGQWTGTTTWRPTAPRVPLTPLPYWRNPYFPNSPRTNPPISRRPNKKPRSPKNYTPPTPSPSRYPNFAPYPEEVDPPPKGEPTNPPARKTPKIRCWFSSFASQDSSVALGAGCGRCTYECEDGDILMDIDSKYTEKEDCPLDTTSEDGWKVFKPVLEIIIGDNLK